MKVRAMALLLVAGLALISPGRATAGPTAAAPEAAAWLVHLEAPTGLVLRLGEATARSGAAPRAQAAPVAMGDAAPVRAVADPSRPDDKVVATPLRWSDPSGSMTVEAAFAEAQAGTAAATARAGFGTAKGTGYTVASLFTREQHERFLVQMQALNQAVFGPLNARMAALVPALAAAGVAAPRFEPMSPLALIDVGGQRLAAASAEAAANEGFTSARAEAALEGIRLLGGFVEARAVSAEAVSEGAGGGEGRARAGIGGLTVAGVPVVADGAGIRVAANDVFSRTVVQPAIDVLIDSLRRQGVELRTAEVRGEGPARQVAGLEVRLATPEGRWTMSVAGARASAPDVPPSPAPAAPPPPSVPTTERPACLAPSAPTTEQLACVVYGSPAETRATPPSSFSWSTGEPGGEAPSEEGALAPLTLPGAPTGPARRADLPGAGTRFPRAVFLLFAVAGGAGALALPAVVSPGARTTRRRTPR